MPVPIIVACIVTNYLVTAGAKPWIDMGDERQVRVLRQQLVEHCSCGHESIAGAPVEPWLP